MKYCYGNTDVFEMRYAYYFIVRKLCSSFEKANLTWNYKVLSAKHTEINAK